MCVTAADCRLHKHRTLNPSRQHRDTRDPSRANQLANERLSSKYLRGGDTMGHRHTQLYILDTRYTRNTNLAWRRVDIICYQVPSQKYPHFRFPMSLSSTHDSLKFHGSWSLPCLAACCCHVSTRTPGHVNMRTRQYFAIQYPHHMHTLFSSVNTYLKVEIQCFRYYFLAPYVYW